MASFFKKKKKDFYRFLRQNKKMKRKWKTIESKKKKTYLINDKYNIPYTK